MQIFPVLSYIGSPAPAAAETEPTAAEEEPAAIVTPTQPQVVDLLGMDESEVAEAPNDAPRIGAAATARAEAIAKLNLKLGEVDSAFDLTPVHSQSKSV